MNIDGITFNPTGTQAALSCHPKEGLSLLVTLLQGRGFAVLGELGSKVDETIAVMVDMEQKSIYPIPAGMMAIWCVQIGRPSSVGEFIQYLRLAA